MKQRTENLLNLIFALLATYSFLQAKLYRLFPFIRGAFIINAQHPLLHPLTLLLISRHLISFLKCPYYCFEQQVMSTLTLPGKLHCIIRKFITQQIKILNKLLFFYSLEVFKLNISHKIAQ